MWHLICILDTLQIPVYKSRLIPRYIILLQLAKPHIHLNTSLMIISSRTWERKGRYLKKIR